MLPVMHCKVAEWGPTLLCISYMHNLFVVALHDITFCEKKKCLPPSSRSTVLSLNKWWYTRLKGSMSVWLPSIRFCVRSTRHGLTDHRTLCRGVKHPTCPYCSNILPPGVIAIKSSYMAGCSETCWRHTRECPPRWLMDQLAQSP